MLLILRVPACKLPLVSIVMIIQLHLLQQYIASFTKILT